MSELKPCPFCGMKHPVELYMDEETVNKGMYQVTCNSLKGGCGSSGVDWCFEEEAIEEGKRWREIGGGLRGKEEKR